MPESSIRRTQATPTPVASAAPNNSHSLPATAPSADGFDGEALKAPGRIAVTMGPSMASPKGRQVTASCGTPRAVETHLIAPDKIDTKQPAPRATLRDYKWLLAAGVVGAVSVVVLSLVVPSFLAVLVSTAPVTLLLAGVLVLTALARLIAGGIKKAIAYFRPANSAVHPAGPPPSSRNDTVPGAQV